MKIAIIGYGKMGKTIATLAREAGDEIILIIGPENPEDLRPDRLQQADVAIEFTRPETAAENIRACIEAGLPVVSGTTAWLEQKPEVDRFCRENGGAFFYASNFSIGVNIFFAVNRHLARLMNEHPHYQVLMEEIHHTAKLDAPSGTAITLAEDIIRELDRKESWVNDESSNPEEIPIISRRIDPKAGTHMVHYRSYIDTISIVHEAHTREGFARGALSAARWLIGKRGVFGMQDMLGF